MSNKSSDKKQTKLRGERWQDKQFFLTKKYKDGLREMIWSRRRLSGKAQHVGLRILDRFASTPTIFANLEKLAGECDMSRPTLRSYLQELSKAGLFRFDTPPYWKRKSGHATEIHFPTKAVEKWLRDNGFFMTMERNLPWSKAEKVNKTGVSTPAKLQNTPSTMERNFRSFHKNEASAPVAAPLSGAGSAPPQERKASSGLSEANAMARAKLNGLKLGTVLTHPKLGKGPIAVRCGDVGDRHCEIYVEFDRGGYTRLKVGSPEFNELSLAANASAQHGELYAVGDVVVSEKLGKGPVVEIERDGDDVMYWVDFDRSDQIGIRPGSPSFEFAVAIYRRGRATCRQRVRQYTTHPFAAHPVDHS